MSSYEFDPLRRAETTLAAALLPALRRIEAEGLSEDALAAVLQASVRLYAARVEAGERGRALPAAEPADGQGPLSATEILTLVSALLAEAEIETFELALWRQWNREHVTA
ncbi:MAG: hypothetical protein ACU0DT_22020 [Albimonas sp.]|uniref:hypothetical protein n=1 Tax=Albimonas sp. TaxID=1872425 RepID=UPI004056A3DD